MPEIQIGEHEVDVNVGPGTTSRLPMAASCGIC